MEFHADAVAASVSGGNNLVTALHRVEMADYGYNYTLEKCNELYRQKKISANIYSNQASVFQKIAMDFKLPVENGLPVINDDFLRGHKLSRVNYKDQWASHPTTDDREQHLLGLGVTVEPVHKSAWILFENIEHLQTQLTQKIYENVVKSDDIVTINEKEFNEKITEEIKTFSFPDEYKNFYDARQIVPINESDFTSANGTISLDDLLSAENISLPKQINAIASDIEVLKAIALKNLKVKTFDFDGVKYNSNEAANVAERLETEQEQLKSRLQNIDRQLIQFFYSQALTKENGAATELKEKYMTYFRFRNKADDFLKQINTMLESLQRIYSGETLTIEVIDSTIGTLKNIHEPLFKDWLKYWLSVDAFALDQETKATAEKFINSDYKYFAANSFFDNELIELNKLCNDGWSSVSNFLFLQFKSILELQLRLK
jgi:hypothetical protein